MILSEDCSILELSTSWQVSKKGWRWIQSCCEEMEVWETFWSLIKSFVKPLFNFMSFGDLGMSCQTFPKPQKKAKRFVHICKCFGPSNLVVPWVSFAKWMTIREMAMKSWWWNAWRQKIEFSMSTYCSVQKQEASRIEVKMNVCCARNLTMYQLIHQLSTFSGECPLLEDEKGLSRK